MDPKTFVSEYLHHAESGQGSLFLTEHATQLNASFATDTVAELKARADEFQRSSTSDCQRVVDAMVELADFTQDELHEAMANFAQGNMEIFVIGRYTDGLKLLQQAEATFEAKGKQSEKAKIAISQVAGLASLGQYEDAVEVAQRGRDIFRQTNDMQRYAAMTMNLASVYKLRGDIDQAEALYSECHHDFIAMSGAHKTNPSPAKGQPKNGNVGIATADESSDPKTVSGLAETEASSSGSEMPEYHIGWSQGNRARLLRTLGRYAESIHASLEAQNYFNRAEQASEAYRARQNLAVTYAIIGRTNQAIKELVEVETFYNENSRVRDAIRVELFLCEILFRIHRYEEVVNRCRDLRERARAIELQNEVALGALIEGQALRLMGQEQLSVDVLQIAADIFFSHENNFALARVQLERALIALDLGNIDEAHSRASIALEQFQGASAAYDVALAQFVLAKALIAENNQAISKSELSGALRVSNVNSLDDARSLLQEISNSGVTLGVPLLIQLGNELLGDLAVLDSQYREALTKYDASLSAIETLNGNLMVEHRIDFASGNQHIYEKAVNTALELDELEAALSYAERAKSRSLLEVMAYQIDLRLEAREAADEQLIEQLKELQARRNQIVRELESNEELRFTNTSVTAQPWADVQSLAEYEVQITKIWEQLLVRNADYAKDAALQWQWQGDSIQPCIEPGTLVLEYFTIGERLIAFLIDRTTLQVRQLDANLSQVNELITFFDLNCSNVVPHQHDAKLTTQLTKQAQQILADLFDALIRPFVAELSAYHRLLIVPHQSLHHLPFHALYDGDSYLIETHAVHYLPNAALIRFFTSNRSTNSECPGSDIACVAFGYDNNKQLPYSVSEAIDVAQLLGGDAYVEAKATCEQLRTVASDANILHISTHGAFQADNPLFSGLAFADGSLTVLDVFDLKLNASLVVLSACQTGRSVVSGGGELLGLLRGFLSAGAESLLLTHWPVEDRSTSVFMTKFYQSLLTPNNSSQQPQQEKSQPVESVLKIDALRRTQQHFIHANPSGPTSPNTPNTPDSPDYRHPYWWASFFLVGHPGPICSR